MKKKLFLLATALLFTTFAFSHSDGTSEKKDFVPYRGMRMPKEVKEFSVVGIFGNKTNNGERELLEITIRLSKPVDPRSVKNDTVLINGEKCGSNVFFHYGRRGETIRISVLDPKDENYSVEFLTLESFDGEHLAQKKYNVELK